MKMANHMLRNNEELGGGKTWPVCSESNILEINLISHKKYLKIFQSEIQFNKNLQPIF